MPTVPPIRCDCCPPTCCTPGEGEPNWCPPEFLCCTITGIPGSTPASYATGAGATILLRLDQDYLATLSTDVDPHTGLPLESCRNPRWTGTITLDLSQYVTEAVLEEDLSNPFAVTAWCGMQAYAVTLICFNVASDTPGMFQAWLIDNGLPTLGGTAGTVTCRPHFSFTGPLNYTSNVTPGLSLGSVIITELPCTITDNKCCPNEFIDNKYFVYDMDFNYTASGTAPGGAGPVEGFACSRDILRCPTAEGYLRPAFDSTTLIGRQDCVNGTADGEGILCNNFSMIAGGYSSLNHAFWMERFNRAAPGDPPSFGWECNILDAVTPGVSDCGPLVVSYYSPTGDVYYITGKEIPPGKVFCNLCKDYFIPKRLYLSITSLGPRTNYCWSSLNFPLDYYSAASLPVNAVVTGPGGWYGYTTFDYDSCIYSDCANLSGNQSDDPNWYADCVDNLIAGGFANQYVHCKIEFLLSLNPNCRNFTWDAAASFKVDTTVTPLGGPIEGSCPIYFGNQYVPGYPGHMSTISAPTQCAGNTGTTLDTNKIKCYSCDPFHISFSFTDGLLADDVYTGLLCNPTPFGTFGGFCTQYAGFPLCNNVQLEITE